MKFEEAIKLLKEGKKVRCNEMGKDVYFFRKDKEIHHRGICNTEKNATKLKDFFSQDWWDSDWEEFKEEDDWNIKKELREEIHSECYFEEDVETLKAKLLEDLQKGTETSYEDLLTKRFGF